MPLGQIKKTIYVFQVTWNFKIRTVGWKIFSICLKFLYGVNRKNNTAKLGYPHKILKNFRVGGEKLGTVR